MNDIPQYEKQMFIDDNNDNNISDLNLIEQIGYINAKIGEEPKIGLNNIGATCYMNATLQCLSHTTKLTNYFLSPKNQNYINSDENIFSKSYLEVLKKLWIKQYNNNRNNYSPNEFKNILSQLNPLFQGVAANDSKDLVNFVLEQLHSELNKNKYNNNINNNDIFLNQNDEQNVLNYFLEEFKKNQQSIISDIFYGIIETRTECLQCKQNNQFNNIFYPIYSYNFQIINFIIFPLEEIRKTKSEINNFNYNEVNLFDCFEYDRKPNIMNGQNAMYCNTCKAICDCVVCTNLITGPEILILLLNRGNRKEFDIKIIFDENLDLTKYIEKGGKYKLMGVISHLGESGMGGHFIAYCKDPITQKWYKYNDLIVDEVQDFKKEVIDFAMPYLLFYEKI
jgi:ubiquitin carboxyl-terminal hydrolase 2/21